MLGLIRKDLLIARRYTRMMVMVLAVYMVVGIMGNFAQAIGIIVVLASLMTTMTAFAYDDQAKWDGYAAALPVSRKTVVQARYLMAMGMVVAGILACLLLSAIIAPLRHTPFLEMLPVILGCGAAAALVLAIYLPIIYKFGTEKSRYLFFGLFAIIGVGGYFMGKSGVKLHMPKLSPWILGTLGIVVFLLLMVASYAVSVMIYKKKEF